jgi:inner membrane protein
VAEAGLGRTLGRKAILWGLLFGTLPDLDILAYPFLDVPDQLYWHRGLSHSLLAMALLSPFLGLFLHRIHGSKAPPKRAMWTCFFIYATHILIDCFNVYGTQILEPFSSARFGLNNLFIIDPLFTVPLLCGVAGALIFRHRSGWRGWINRIGLILATLYVGWSFSAQGWMHSRFKNELAAQEIGYQRGFIHPTPFNTLLWRGLYESKDGYFVGYSSLLDSDSAIQFQYIPHRQHLIDPVRDTEAVEALLWFSQGFFLARIGENGLEFSDLRFGEFEDPNGEVSTFFSWQIRSDAREVTIRPLRPERPEGTLQKLWNRIKGVKPPQGASDPQSPATSLSAK